MGPRVVLDGCGKSRSPNRDSIPGPSNQERVTIPTELSRPTCLVYVAEITATNAYNFFFSENVQKCVTVSEGVRQDVFIPVFLNCRAAARYRALASIIPGRERPEETTICYKIWLVRLITNLNVILYLSTCHTVYISVLILFMIMP